MKRLLISLLASLTTLSAMAQVSFGDAVRFDNGWRFHLGDVENARADYEKCLTLVTNYQRAIDGLNALDKKSKK